MELVGECIVISKVEGSLDSTLVELDLPPKEVIPNEVDLETDAEDISVED